MAKIDNFTKEDIEKIVKESGSYKEVLRKLGYTASGNNHLTLKNRLDRYGIGTEHFYTGNKPTFRTHQNVFCENSTASQATLRRWYKNLGKPYICECCGISEWLGKPLVLQVDHKNGNNHDNRVENLRWICPNCHSQTSTFCGKQIKKNHATSNGITNEKHISYCIDCGKEISNDSTRCLACASKRRRVVDRPSADELKNILLENNGNFLSVGRVFGVSGNAVVKWCKQYEMPFHTSDYTEKKIKDIHRNTGVAKSVVRVDRNTGEPLQVYKSINDASRWLYENNYTGSNDINGISAHICVVCSGKRKSAYEFMWRFSD